METKGERQPPQQEDQTEEPFDSDRIQDIFIAHEDRFNTEISKAREFDHHDMAAESGSALFNDYLRIIQGYPPNNKTTEEYISFLKQKRAEKIDQRKKRQSTRLENEIESLRSLIKFLQEDLNNPSANNSVRIEYQQQQAEIARKNNEALMKEESAKTEEQLENTRAEIENDNEREKQELINEIIETCGSTAYTSWPKSLAPEKSSGGFANKSDENISSPSSADNIPGKLRFLTGHNNYASNFPENRTLSIDQAMANKGVTEVVYLEPVEENITREETTHVDEYRPGILGFGGRKVQVPKTEFITTGKRQIPMSEKTKNGDDTPSWRLLYSTTSNDFDRHYEYKDYSNRTGNTLSAEIILPEKLAKKLNQIVRKDPEFIHRLIDELMIRDLQVPKEVWESGSGDAQGHPMRPPYEKWRQADGGKSKIYVVERSEIEDAIDNGTVDYNPEFIIEY